MTLAFSRRSEKVSSQVRLLVRLTLREWSFGQMTQRINVTNAWRWVPLLAVIWYAKGFQVHHNAADVILGDHSGRKSDSEKFPKITRESIGATIHLYFG